MAHAKKKRNKTRRGRGFFFYLIRIMLCISVVLLVWPIYFVVLYKFVPVYYTPLMLQRKIEGIGMANKPSAQKEWVSYEEISPALTRAVISSEDNLFQSTTDSVSTICKRLGTIFKKANGFAEVAP